jgi:DNA-binding transcriptional MerR regulator
MSKKLVLSKDIVEKYNITYPTLTLYTNLGFFTVAGRKGNKRLYDEEEVKKRLPQVQELVKQGYPLRLIREKINSVIQ